jgi:hypothetical protein
VVEDDLHGQGVVGIDPVRELLGPVVAGDGYGFQVADVVGEALAARTGDVTIAHTIDSGGMGRVEIGAQELVPGAVVDAPGVPRIVSCWVQRGQSSLTGTYQGRA